MKKKLAACKEQPVGKARGFLHLQQATGGKLQAGFTLIEMIVSVALFAIVMLICVSSLLALVGANRKAQALESVTSNIDMALDGMSRAIRMGSDYHCGASGASVPLQPQDCSGSNGDTYFAFEPYGNTSANQPTVYYFSSTDQRIYRSVAGAPAMPITAPEVTINALTFYVVGTTRGDTTQPKVVIIVKGTAPVQNSQARTSFHIQITAVQRLLDL